MSRTVAPSVSAWRRLRQREWQVHAYCLMRNHFYLVIETPQPNLVAGMKRLLGVYTKRFNIRHKTCAHLFAGSYKALIVDGRRQWLSAHGLAKLLLLATQPGD